MSIVSVAIVISFHLKSQPTAVERRVALPVGLLFWLLSLACLISGVANYIKTVEKYLRRRALVQSGWKTQVVSAGLCSSMGQRWNGKWKDTGRLMPWEQVFTIVATAIVAVCVLFLSTNAAQQR